MSRTLIDPVEDPKADADGYLQPSEETPEDPKPTSELDEWIAAKGAVNKTPEEWAAMYRSLEQDHGRLRNEVGESRQLLDRVLRLEEGTKQESEPEEYNLDATEFLTNPRETLEAYLARRDAQKQAEYDARIRQLEAQVGQQTLQSVHQDAQQVLNSPEFIQYVQASPIRTRYAQAALANQDINALGDLLTEYKSTLSQKEEKPKRQSSPTDRARAATLEGGTAGGGGESSGKIFSRQALIKMMIEDRERYSDPEFQRELMLAHAEGRVK